MTTRIHAARPGFLPTVLRTLLLAVVTALIALSACVPADVETGEPGDGATSAPPVTAGEPTEPDEPAADDAGGEQPLLLNLSIHVEGFTGETIDEALFERHVAAVETIAAAAEAHGARLTFQLSETFADAVLTWGSSIVDELLAAGHAVTVHADLGYPEPGYDEFVADLTARREQLEALTGGAVRSVSGICSEADWVEAAAAAGFEIVDGITEFCLKTLPEESLPAGHESVLACSAPNLCHASAIDDVETASHPWRTSDSASWLTPDDAGSVIMLPGIDDTSVACGDEGTVGGCELGAGDVPLVTALLEQYLAAHDGTEVSVMTLSWSVGRPPTAAAADELFAALEAYTADGRVAWTTTEALVGLLA